MRNFITQYTAELMRVTPVFWCAMASICLGADVFALSNPSSATDPSAADFSSSLTVERLFRLSNVGALNFPAYTGSGNPSMSDDVCVWTNHTSGQYRVTANGNGAAGVFQLTRSGGGASGTLPFTVTWTTPTTTVTLSANSISSNLSGANTSSPSCASSALTTSFTVSIDRNTLLAQPSGSYAGTLTFVISSPTS